MSGPAERPYTPETLAKHWDCSARTVRNLISAGELRAFPVGPRLLRIKPEWVRDYECRKEKELRNPTPSDGLETNDASSTETPPVTDTATPSAPLTRARLRNSRRRSMPN